LTSYKAGDRPKIVDTFNKLNAISGEFNSSDSNHYVPSPSSKVESEYNNKDAKSHEPSYTVSPVGANSVESNSTDTKKS